jgi:tRNA threonylcarbamoyladenosine biosynthesis protein TsaB
MIVLAIDTCEARGSIAVLKDKATLQTVPHTVTEEYSSWLLPAVDSALEFAEIPLGEVDLFAAASGPGSFTGVRIGLTTVKAWSEVFSKSIVAISRLEAVAAQSESSARYVASFIDAQRDQIFGALYDRTEGGLALVGQEMVAPPDVFVEWVDEQASGNDEVGWISTDPDTLAKHPAWQPRATRADKIQCVPCVLAPFIGKMAFQRAVNGNVLDALSVDANYVRRSYVEVFQKGPARLPGK